MMKKLIILVLGIALGSSLLFAAAEGEQDTNAQDAAKDTPVKANTAESTGTAVVVTVNGEKVLEKDISQQMNKRIEVQLKRMPEGSVIPETAKQQLRKQIVDMEVEKILLNQELTKKKLTVTDEQVLEAIMSIAKSRDQTLEDVEKEIAEYGMTLEDLKDQMRPQIQIETLMEAVKPESKVTDEAVKAFYDENPQNFEQPEQVKASHILCGRRGIAEADYPAELEKIKAAQERLKKGESFEAVAKAVSDCPSSADGGDLGFFGKGQMDPAFEKVAFELKPGETSDIVKTSFGYHIIKVTEKKDAEEISFNDAKDNIMRYLKQNNLRTFWPEYQKELNENSTIEYSEKEKALREAAKPPVRTPMPVPTPATPAEE